jgi:apolipoprotein N-acyltransferase
VQAIAGYFAAGIVVGALATGAAYAVAVSATFGAFAVGASRLLGPGHGLGARLAVASLWVAVELARGRGLGQPWALLGYTQHGVTPLIQMASVTGVYGVSFVVALGNVALAEAFARRRAGVGLVASLRALAPAGAMAAALAVAGALAIHLDDFVADRPVGGAQRVLVVQSNVPPAFQWTRPYAESQFLALARLTNAAAREQRPALVVWPEHALPLYLEQEPVLAVELERIAQRAGADLVLGSPRFADGQTYNSVRLVRPGAGATAAYDKQRLVPFAEAPPPFATGVASAEQDESPRAFAAGTTPGVLRGGMLLGASICHEALYPEVVNGAVAEGAEVLVNVANDGWLDGEWGVASRQHFAMTTFRAVETRRPLVRAATTGVSGVFGASVVPRQGLTPYVRFGDAFAAGCVLFAVLALVPVRRPLGRRAPRRALVSERT